VSILVVAPRYAPDPGGIERLLTQVLPELRAEGLEVVVVSGTDQGLITEDSIDGVPVYRLPFGQAVQSGQPENILRVASRLREVEQAHGVGIRHVQGFGDIGLWYALRAHQRRPLPLGISVHGTVDPMGPIGSTSVALLRAAHEVSAVSEAVMTSVITSVPDCADRIRLIRNGLRAHAEKPAPWRSDGHLLAVGRLADQKGFDVAIDALALLQPAHCDVELVIVGSGPRRNALRDRAARIGVGARVRIVDHLPAEEIASAMNTASVVLVPSRAIEGFSLVALEAAHAARPVVSSRVGGLAETIEDGVTGIVVRPDDPIALAAAVDRLLNDPRLAGRMGLAGRQRALEQFDLSRCVTEYLDMYRDLGAHARHEHPVEAEPSSA
jgi:glycogen synthase